MCTSQREEKRLSATSIGLCFPFAVEPYMGPANATAPKPTINLEMRIALMTTVMMATAMLTMMTVVLGLPVAGIVAGVGLMTTIDFRMFWVLLH